MSVLVWIMGDGEHRDMIATCRAGNGEWVTLRWNWRPEHDMVGYGHDDPFHADSLLKEWTREYEVHGSVIIAGPVELPITPPTDTTDQVMERWWNRELRPMVLCLELTGPTDSSWDEECTLDLSPPTGTHAAWEALVIKCGPPAPYLEKLSWGPR